MRFLIVVDDCGVYWKEYRIARDPDDAIGEAASEGAEVAEFCTRKGLAKALRGARDIARRCFDECKRVRIEKEVDPETDDEWVNVVVDVAGTVDGILEQYDHYVTEVVASLSWDERKSIHLRYNIV